jgi:hypothetical protein
MVGEPSRPGFAQALAAPAGPMGDTATVNTAALVVPLLLAGVGSAVALVLAAVTVKLLGEAGTTSEREFTAVAPLASEGVALKVMIPVVAS